MNPTYYKYIFIKLLLLLPVLVFSQEFNYVFEPDSIPVEIQGWNPYCPFSGGMSRSNPDIEDLDSDSDLDIFIGSQQSFKYFMNTGNYSVPDFCYLPEVTSNLETEGNNSAKLCDIDNDEDFDLFATSDERVWYFENTGTPTSPQFELITDSLEQVTTWASNLDLVDIDSDGDYDMFTGRGDGILVFYLNEGTPDSFHFTLEAFPFLNINVYDMSDPCFVDIDDDNDYDLFIGVGSPGGEICYYRNDGDSVNYDYTYVTDNYAGIDVGSYSSPEFADIDGDGDYDLFIGSGGRTYYYENIGTPEIPQFDYITDSYMTFEPGWLVQVVDINGDDAPDLIVGAGSFLTYTENIGTPSYPAFSYITNNFQGISRSVIKPCFVDIDADGDYDLLAGEGVIPGPPTIAFYANNGTPTEPNLQLINENYITNNNFVVNANPCVADIDADGDYDLFVTTDEEYFFFYRNEGTPSSPDFTLVSSQWQGISDFVSWRGMSFGDIDEDGDLDLLIRNVWQTDYGNLRFYRNEGTPQEADMVLETNVFLPGYELPGAYPYLADIDSDNDLDIFVGESSAGIMFFRNHGYGGVVLSLTPHNTPIQIQSGGGFFNFDVEVENVSTTNYIIDFITDATLPNGSSYPIFLRPNITLNAGVTIIRLDIMQAVPGHAPAGEYLYNGYVRDVSTQDTLAVDWFEFTKLTGN